jgi:glycosyltransferase involved in cell wall biosynthesis
MENKLLIYIVSYERMSYTQGTIECLHKTKPANSQIIVCDNGSTDGTREWLEENQEKYELGLIFPEENLRVGGAWTLLTNYYNEDDFDYILLLDNDGWLIPDRKWFNKCLSLFNIDPQIGSLGLEIRPNPGFYSMAMTPDPNYKNKIPHLDMEYYDTVYFAGFRLDKFPLWHKTMSNWPHKFIGDKIGKYYNSLGYRTIQYTPGFIVDVSQYDFTNPAHDEYNRWFYERERNLKGKKYNSWVENWINNVNPIKDPKSYIEKTFGKDYLKHLNL